MQLLALAAAVAVAVATVAAALIMLLGNAAATWTRRVFLVLLNLNPWTAGRWRDSFSRRETFLAAWFLAFIAALFALAFLGGHHAP